MTENLENQSEKNEQLFSDAAGILEKEDWKQIADTSTAEELGIDPEVVRGAILDLRNEKASRGAVDCFLTAMHFYEDLFREEKDEDKKEALGEKLTKITEMLNELHMMANPATKREWDYKVP